MKIQDLREFTEQMTEYHTMARYEASCRAISRKLVPAYMKVQLAVECEPARVAIAISAIRQIPADHEGEAGHYLDQAREILMAQAAKEIHAWMYPPPPPMGVDEHAAVEP